MELSHALSAPFQDADWFKKFGILGLLMLVPIIGWWMVLGWMARLTKQVIDGHTLSPLPDINFGIDLEIGFKAFIVTFVINLPCLAMSIATMANTAAREVALTESQSAGGFGPEAFFGITCLSVALSFGSLIVSLFFSLMTFAAMGNFAAEGYQIGAGLSFRKAWQLILAAPGAYMIIVALNYGLGYLSVFGIPVFCIGFLFTTAYTQGVLGIAYGMAYRKAKGQA